MRQKVGRARTETVLAGIGLLFPVLFGVLGANRAGAQELPQTFTPIPAEACEGKEPGASCWMEIADRPGCYLWNPNLAAGATVTWSGECSGGLAQGMGSRQWTYPDDEGNPLVSGGEGEMRGGRRHGPWTLYGSNGGLEEGSFDHGDRVGSWTHVFADGTVFEGEWANGQQQGRWTSTYGDDVGGGFYAAGKRHGRWKLLFAASDDETVRGTAEGLYVAGNRNGTWVTRFEGGTVHELTWRHGVPHGPSSSRYRNGAVDEGSYQEGKKHGRWTERTSDGAEDSGEYKEGKKHGYWTERSSSGRDEESGEFLYKEESGEYKQGVKHGRWTSGPHEGRPIISSPFNDLVVQVWGTYAATGPYEDGKQHGEWVYRFEDGYRIHVTWDSLGPNGPYSEWDGDGGLVQRGQLLSTSGNPGIKTGMWEERYWWEGNRGTGRGAENSREVEGHAKGPYVDDKRHGTWVLKYNDYQEEEGPYVDGERHGVWTRRHRHGGRFHDELNVSKITFVNGAARGEWQETGEWIEGSAHNDCSRRFFVEGKEEGRTVIWRSNGQVYVVDDHRGGRSHGLRLFPGSPRGSVHHYVEGREVSSRYFKTEKQWRRWLRDNPGVLPERDVRCNV